MPEKTGLKNVENMEKSKNEEHFIISVLKVGQGKKILFLWFLYVFMLFWGGQKMSVKIFFWKYFDPPQKSMKTYKNHKNKNFLPWPTFKTDIIKCSRFLDFFTFSTFFSFVKICLFFSKISITDGVILPIATDVLGPTKVPTIRYWGKFHF